MIKIGILGCGTIGGGVIRLLESKGVEIQQKMDNQIEIKKVLARTPDKARAIGVPEEKITQDPDDIINDPEIQIVVELIGGIDTAKDFISRAIKAGKNVVTANKDLIARHGNELYKLANEKNIDLYYEASVGGGIPIIMPMRRTLAGNSILSMIGILNGTTNYMLTRMSKEGMSYDAVLKEAQDLGFAEQDPTSDVDGLDAGRKIAILAKLAFNADVSDLDVRCEGIRGVRQRDIVLAKDLGYTIKLLAVAKDKEEGIELGVYPSFIPERHPLAAVSDAYNALYVTGDAVGDVMLYGLGAGAMPTASSVVGDIMQIARHIKAESTGIGNDLRVFDKQVLPAEKTVYSYYVCMTVDDKPNVLSAIAKGFGDHNVSIQSVVQKHTTDNWAELVLITHDVEKKDIDAALKTIGELPEVGRVDNVLRVMNDL
ncbi:MAG: homoserine dehydrogenase [Fastidiosipilaceae bacterium]|jgi:homoserine dehydrogenase